MSGIFGIFHRNGKPVEKEVLASMGQAMEFWGPDGMSLWSEGPVGLGHLLLGNKSPADAGPFVSPDSGAVLTAAARIDNRDELGHLLGMSPAEIRDSPDHSLILESYQSWGKECVHRLLGDWSFALWDPIKQRLLVARDHCGISGIYYYQDEDLFAFASSLKGLLALPQVPRRPNQMRLVRLITAWVEGMNFGDTFYQDIQRLAPSHRVWVELARSRLEEYWTVENVSPLQRSCDEEYLEAFRETYEAAVRCRLGTDRGVGIFLSSGLDSGSVAALAAPELARRNQRLDAFTSVPAHDPVAFGVAGNEGPVAQSTARWIGNTDVHLVQAGEISPFDGVLRGLAILQEPAHAASNFYWLLAILEEARNRDVGVMLTGQFGNLTVSWSGYGDYVRRLLRTGQISRYWQEARAWRKTTRATLTHTVKKQVVRPAIPFWLLRFVNRIRFRAAGPFLLLNPGLAQGLDLRRRMLSSGHDPGFAETDSHLLRRLMLMHSLPRAHLSELAAAHQLEIRDPTVDRRLVEFCLGIPEDQFHGLGHDRLLIRRAFAGLLPEAVLWNPARGIQAADVGRRLVEDAPDLKKTLAGLQRCRPAAAWLDLPRMSRLVERIGSSSGSGRLTPSALLKGFMVGVFLARLQDEALGLAKEDL